MRLYAGWRVKTRRAAPKASTLIESMRDIGYSLETALADIIDNSITAGARRVRLFALPTNSDAMIGILDDGRGMDEEQLFESMRLGSKSPLELREGDDLGRFGLGLKTASFSQCRRLTVVTRNEDGTHCARWDLDDVAKTDDWLVQLPSSIDGIPHADQIGEHGTLVLWEKLDRLVDGGEDSQQYLNQKLDEAANHLSLVFHRFLSGEKGLKKLTIELNGNKLEPFDPFHSDHPATDPGQVEKIRIRDQIVTLQPFTLPHHKKVTPAEWEKYAGAAGYIKNQGFYVYRAKRLIIHGTWFGLARQLELTKLARVKIDMPNGLDIDWKVDVKKASAHPPRVVRNRLRVLVESIGSASKRVFEGPKKRATKDRIPIWRRLQDKNLISYSLDPDNPVLANFMERLGDDTREDFLKILEIIGSTIPVDAIFADIGGSPEQVAGELLSPEAMEHAVVETFKNLSNTGLTKEAILEMLNSNDLFRANWKATQKIIDKYFQGA